VVTIVEKIIAAHSPDDVHLGATVWLVVDVRAARDFGGADVARSRQGRIQVGRISRERAGLGPAFLWPWRPRRR